MMQPPQIAWRWGTVKYEDVYPRDYETPAEARLSLGRHFAVLRSSMTTP
jgi:hypothetical protein